MSISHLSLFKRSNGFWYILYLDEGRTRWKSTGKTLKHEALKVLTEFREHLKKRCPVVLLSEFVTQFQTMQAQSLRQSTIQRIYLPSFDAFLGVCGNKALAAYTLRDVETFKRAQLENKCSPTYVNIQFRSLRAAFNLAVKWQLLRENPFSISSTVKQPEKLPSFLTKGKFNELLAAVREPVLRDVFRFAALTGMRQGEILNLRWAEADLERKLVTVTSSGRFTTKTGKVRVLPMCDVVFDIVSRRKLTASGEYVFHRNGYPLASSYVTHKFKKYVRQAGLSEDLHFHSLRHTFATWLVKDGASIYEVQKLLGHSSVGMTEGYSHLAASELHSVVNRASLGLN